MMTSSCQCCHMVIRSTMAIAMLLISLGGAKAANSVEGDSIFLFNTNQLSGNWGLALNSGGALPTSPVSGNYTAFQDATLNVPNKPLVGDVNGDGISDIITVEKKIDVGAEFTIFQARNTGLTDGVGDLAAPAVGDVGWDQNWTPYWETTTTDTFLADVDGDGRDDAISVRPSDWDANLDFWQAVHSVSTGLDDAGPTSWTGVGVVGNELLMGDFNGDGAADVADSNASGLVAGVLSTPGLGLAFGDGTNEFWGSVEVNANPIATLIGDIDGDGMDDIVRVDDRNSDGSWTWVAGLTSAIGATPSGIEITGGGLSWAAPFALEATSTAAFPLLADINNDGRDDLVLYEEYTSGDFNDTWGRMLVSFTDDPAGGLFTNEFNEGTWFDYYTLFSPFGVTDGGGFIPVVGNVHGMTSVEEDADFDGDGDVDGTDFLTWQQNYLTGSTLAQGDANGDGLVNDVDLQIWEGQFGVTSLSSTAAAVPEPGTLLLVGFGAMLCLVIRR